MSCPRGPVRLHRDLAEALLRAARQFSAVTLTGPRQSGKSMLCRSLFPGKPYANLEAPDIRSFATDDPRAFLARFPQGAILDEVQRTPDLPAYLQGLIDDDLSPGRWLLTGSRNLALPQSVSQSLAGRSAVLHLLPLARSEVVRFERHPRGLDEALVAGGYPGIFDRGLDPADWIQSYVATYLERDVRTITNVGDLATFQRFVERCAGLTGQLLNHSSLASDCGISQPIAKAWLNVLEASFIAFRLPVFHSNHRKRLVKMPKLHFHDTGLACWLLGIRSAEQLRSHPLRGAIFETWVVSEMLKHRSNRGLDGGLSFCRGKDGVEADLVVEDEGKLVAIDAKSAATVARSFSDEAARVRGLLEADGRPVESLIVYGGDEPQVRTEATLLPWNRRHERWGVRTSP